jgi:SpoVK/Ycf46/Vps4 family AAA+-type ATPase
MLKANCEGVRFAEIGTAGRALRRENYAAAVLREIDHVTHDVEAADPCGRIVLLTGPAGTGKTHLIRSILVCAKRPRFVVVQPGDLRSFLNASPLGALAEFVEDEASGRPVVLIVEDADDCLVPRGTDNMSQIAALLNLSDGLVGSAFDIRVLATTNAKVTEVDSAILRPGRLCRRIEVPPLQPEHATDVLRGLLGAEPRSVFRKPVTLAEVYAAARERPREA